MGQSKAMRFFQILYPICIYFVVTTVVLSLLDFVMPDSSGVKLFRQMISSLASLPFLYVFYRDDQVMRGKWDGRVKIRLPQFSVSMLFLLLLTGACASVFLNNLLGILRITEYSASYAQVEETFYRGRLAFELLALCVVIPVAEELLYRGIVYGRSRDLFGVRGGVVFSAVIFGLIHMNLAQFVYAAVFGLLLAYLTELTDNLFYAAAVHMAANTVSVLRAETELFAFAKHQWGFIALTVGSGAVAAAGIYFFLVRQNQNAK